RLPSGLTCVNAAINGVLPGPLTRCSFGTFDNSPHSSRRRGLVSASISYSASRSFGSAIASNTPTGGRRLGTMRYARCQRMRWRGGSFEAMAKVWARHFSEIEIVSRHSGASRNPVTLADQANMETHCQRSRVLRSPSNPAPAVRKRAGSPALGIQVLPHHEQVGDVAGQHAVQRALAAEGRRAVGPAQPGVGAIGLRKQDRKRLEDAEQVADAFQRVARQRAVAFALPFVERGFRRIAQQLALLRDTQFPTLGKVEEGAQGRSGQYFFVCLGTGPTLADLLTVGRHDNLPP